MVPTQHQSEAGTTVARRLGHWLWRIVLGGIGFLATILVLGLIYQGVSTRLDRQDLPPLGELVDVGGFRLHLYCQGEGSPTVILDALGDGTSAHWGWVQPALATTTRVCAYDRAGRGWSDPSPAPRDAMTFASELHALLTAANINGPLNT